jgi:hypothetical protein
VPAGKENCFHVGHRPPVKPSLYFWESAPHFIYLLVMGGAILLARLKECQALGFKKALTFKFFSKKVRKELQCKLTVGKLTCLSAIITAWLLLTQVTDCQKCSWHPLSLRNAF